MDNRRHPPDTGVSLGDSGFRRLAMELDNRSLCNPAGGEPGDAACNASTFLGYFVAQITRVEEQWISLTIYLNTDIR